MIDQLGAKHAMQIGEIVQTMDASGETTVGRIVDALLADRTAEGANKALSGLISAFNQTCEAGGFDLELDRSSNKKLGRDRPVRFRVSQLPEPSPERAQLDSEAHRLIQDQQAELNQERGRGA